MLRDIPTKFGRQCKYASEGHATTQPPRKYNIKKFIRRLQKARAKKGIENIPIIRINYSIKTNFSSLLVAPSGRKFIRQFREHRVHLILYVSFYSAIGKLSSYFHSFSSPRFRFYFIPDEKTKTRYPRWGPITDRMNSDKDYCPIISARRRKAHTKTRPEFPTTLVCCRQNFANLLRMFQDYSESVVRVFQLNLNTAQEDSFQTPRG